MSRKIIQIDPLTHDHWPEFVRNHPCASAFHSRGWLEALKGTYGYRPAAVAAFGSDGELLSAIPFCYIKSWLTGKRIISLPFSDHCQPLVSEQNEFEQLASALIEAVGIRSYKYIELRPQSVSAMTPRFGNLCHFYLHRLDLRPGATEAFKRFHRDSIQRRIRRAEREKLRVEAGRSSRLINAFYGLMLRTRRRHGLPPQPLAWFENLSSALSDALTIRVVYKDDQAVAGIVTLTHRKTVVYKYGASDERFHNLGGMPFVFWRAIQDASSAGYEEMDMGRTDIDNPGLITFKEHWGATRMELTYWAYPPPKMSRSSEPSWTMRIMHKACSLAPDSLLVAAGSLLYRHAP